MSAHKLIVKTMQANKLLESTALLYECLSAAEFTEDSFKELGISVYNDVDFENLSMPVKRCLLLLVKAYEETKEASEETDSEETDSEETETVAHTAETIRPGRNSNLDSEESDGVVVPDQIITRAEREAAETRQGESATATE